jgi:arginase family enzyme
MRKIQQAPVVVMDFSGVYELEKFADNPDFIHLDCTDIHGSECILSQDAEQEIRRRISPYNARGIHFIDSGDYHYMTRLWTDKIQTPFTLLLVDHHTDMQPSQVPGIVTCGDWVNSVIDHNPYLRKVILLGMPRDALNQIPSPYRDKVEYISKQQFTDILRGKLRLQTTGAIYLSIDKDALSRQCVITNWDQGDINLEESRQFVSLLLDNEQLLGIDVCGEFPIMKSLFDEERAADMDSLANEVILDTVEEHVRAAANPS